RKCQIASGLLYLPRPLSQAQTGGAGGLKLVQVWEQHAPGLTRSQGSPLGVHGGGTVVLVVVVLVEVVVVVVVASGLTDGTHSSRRWIIVTSSGPNWLLMWATVVPNGGLDF